MNLMEILTRLDYNDADIRGRLSEADRREVDKNAAWLLPQWLVGAQGDADHRGLVLMFDELCNTGWQSLYKHPELQLQLLSTIGLGKKTRHKFYRPQVKKTRTTELVDLLRKEYPDIRENEVALFCRDADIDEVEDLMCAHGLPFEQHGDIIKQYENVRNM